MFLVPVRGGLQMLSSIGELVTDSAHRCICSLGDGLSLGNSKSWLFPGWIRLWFDRPAVGLLAGFPLQVHRLV